MEASVEKFMSVTGADHDQATHFLEMSCGNVEMAVELFMDMGGNDLPPANDARTQSRNRPGDESLLGAEDEVRAPDSVKRQRLLDDMTTDEGNGINPETFSLRDFRREEEHISTFSKGSSDLSGSPAKDTQLGDLFRPPHEIMHKGDFNDARATAKEYSKWLMVNIQCEKEFASHQLNRDTWKHDTLQNIIGSETIFWQQYNHTNEGRIYCSRYHANNFPHTALIDPRTGRLMWQQTGFISAEALVDKISDFCCRHSLETHKDNTNATATKSSKSSLKMSPSNVKHTGTENSERALEAETLPSGSTLGDTCMGQSLSAAGVAATKPQPAGSRDSGAGPCADTTDEFADVDLGEECAPSEAGATRIAFRMPSGMTSSMLTRWFRKTDLVDVVFKFVQQQLLQNDVMNTGRQFDVCQAYPRKSLRPLLRTNTTIDSAQLSNAKVTVQWL